MENNEKNNDLENKNTMPEFNLPDFDSTPIPSDKNDSSPVEMKDFNLNETLDEENNQEEYTKEGYRNESEPNSFYDETYSRDTYVEEPDYEPYPEFKDEKKFKNTLTVLLSIIGGMVGGGIILGMSSLLTNQVSFQTYEISSTATSSHNIKDLVDVSDIVEESMASIVAINAKTNLGYEDFFGSQYFQNKSAGSGVIYGKTDTKLYVVTNYHVIDDASEISINFFDGTSTPASIKGTSKSDDLALLEIDLSKIAPNTLNNLKIAVKGDSDKIKVGQGTIAIGNALGYGQTVTNGIVSALDREVNFPDGTSMVMLQTNASINPGNSGGALLNAKGELIGINSAKYADTAVEGIGYAIPINKVSQIIDNIIEGKEAPLSKGVILGITGINLDPQMSLRYNMPLGVLIQFVAEESVADISGLLPGDIISKINNKPIIDLMDLKTELSKLNPGDTATLEINRPSNSEYEQKKITVIF